MDDHRRAPTLHQLRDLVAGSRDTPMTATLRLHDDPAAQQVTITTQQSAEILRLPAGDYLFHAHGPRWAISTTDGEPLLRFDGQHTVVHGVQLSTPGDAEGSAIDDDRLILAAAAQPLIRRDPRIVDYLHERAERTAGPATVITAQRRCDQTLWVVRSARAYDSKHQDGQQRDLVELTVDAHCGVMTALTIDGRRSELLDIDTDTPMTDDMFAWPGPVTKGEPWERKRLRAEFSAELERLSITAPTLPTDHRIIPVTVPTWTVEDDLQPQATLGDTIALSLVFQETDPDNTDAVTVDAWAEQMPGARPVNPQRPIWQSALHGDGWTARWDADHPVAGHVRVTGQFHHDPPISPDRALQPTRGQVVRLQLIDEQLDQQQHIDVAEATLPLPAFWLIDTASYSVGAVRYTLDLDTAQQLEPEPYGAPTWFTGFLVTHTPQPVLWRADARLPLVWKTDLTTGMSTPVSLPLRVTDIDAPGIRLTRATDKGVHVRAAGRRFTITRDDSVIASVIDDPAPDRPAVLDSVDEVAHLPGAGEWIVSDYEPMEELFETPQQAQQAATYGMPVSRGILRLGRVTADGELHWVRHNEVTGSLPRAGLLSVGGKVVLWRHGVCRYLDKDLAVVREASLPNALPDQLRYATPRVSGGFIVLSGGDTLIVVDPADVSGAQLSVLLQVQVTGPAHGQVDDASTVWVADTHLRLFTKDQEGRWTDQDMAV